MENSVQNKPTSWKCSCNILVTNINPDNKDSWKYVCPTCKDYFAYGTLVGYISLKLEKV